MRLAPHTAEALRRDGYTVRSKLRPGWDVHMARRAMWQMLRIHGLTPAEIVEWQGGSFFPWLRDEPWVWYLLPPKSLLDVDPTERWAEPQLLIRLPDTDDVELPSSGHIDSLPPWAAEDEEYKLILSVELTGCAERGGGLRVWDKQGRPVDLEPTRPGDLVFLDPTTVHAGTPNQDSQVRMAVIFRLLGRRWTDRDDDGTVGR